MSDEFHRPTYTSAKKLPNGDIVPTNEDGHYNPTQVRLYGIQAEPGRMLADEAMTLSTYATRMKIEIAFDKLDGWGVNKDIWVEHLDKQIKIAQAFLNQLKIDRDAAALDNFEYANLAWPVKKDKEYRLALDTRELGTVALFASQSAIGQDVAGKEAISSGVMFGYAYEGHTYDFVKPKLMLVPTHPLARIPKDDSGYDLKESEGYAVWIVDKLEQCVEIEIDQGFVEQIVLEANLPGKRSPTMYGAKMALAHRGGS